jgi:AcrR family transcriptional regulator
VDEASVRTADPVEVDRRPGRPRDARATPAILQATLLVLAEEGFNGFSVDRVAAAAGVGKATIYRRWPSKEDLLRDAFGQVVQDLPEPDTGSLRGDLLAFTDTLVDELQALPVLASVMPGLVAASFHDPELQAVLDQFLEKRADCGYALVRAAKARGEVAEDVDDDLVLDLTGAWFFYRMAVLKRPITKGDVREVVDVVLSGLVGGGR